LLRASRKAGHNICAAVRRRAHDRVKQEAQRIYQAASLAEARQAFRYFQRHWQTRYPRVVKNLAKSLPDLLDFYAFPKHRWKKLRTTNIIDRCFVEVRRRTGPMVVFTKLMASASTESFIPSSTASTKIGAPAPLNFSPRELDDTPSRFSLLARPHMAYIT
jgi:hypothetical protein